MINDEVSACGLHKVGRGGCIKIKAYLKTKLVGELDLQLNRYRSDHVWMEFLIGNSSNPQQVFYYEILREIKSYFLGYSIK